MLCEISCDYDDAVQWTILREGIFEARKAKKCCACGHTISKGQFYQRRWWLRLEYIEGFLQRDIRATDPTCVFCTTLLEINPCFSEISLVDQIASWFDETPRAQAEAEVGKELMAEIVKRFGLDHE